MRTAFRPLPISLFAVLLLSEGMALAGDIYTWKDAQGVVHYSDVKPEADNVKIIKGGAKRDLSPPATATATSKQDSAPIDPETAFRKRQAEAADAQAKADKERRQAELQQENCDAARSQLTALKNGERMARYNAAGEKEVLDDAARATEISRIQRDLDNFCK
jgi:uncharacterized protein DUF4124